MIKSLIALWTSFVMLFASLVPTTVPSTDAQSESYPYVFVHGLMGWGEGEGIDDDIPYWGATACDLIENLRAEGYECYAASVGPLSSNWDRACELYAQLTGTTVDYGEAHSAAHNHSRYGRTYSEPLFDGWGKEKKVNLIGHSLGGTTVRLLESLLTDGDSTEIAATPAEELSPLFAGGNTGLVNAVVTVCAPNNGSTLAYLAEELFLTDVLKTLAFTYAGFMGRSFLNGYFDFHLEHFGLTDVPGGEKASQYITLAVSDLVAREDDSVVYDLSPEGALTLNERSNLSEDTYYFSYAFSTTTQEKLTGFHLPIPSTMALLGVFGTMIGTYKENRITDYPIDETWFENDGLVNLKSALYPFDDAHTDYDPENIQSGIWNVMPVSTGDHGSAIGLGSSEEAVMEFYISMIETINSIPSK